MCNKPDVKIGEASYRIEGQIYNRLGALQLLESIGFSNSDAQDYLNSLSLEETK
jgi:hypothetical protein